MEMTKLLARITSDDEDVRQSAIHELAERMDADAARAFLDVLAGDAADEVRADVIVGLGPIVEEAGLDYGDDDDGYELDPELGPGIDRETFDEVIRRLRAAYEDPSQPKLLRRRAFEVLVRDPRPWLTAEVRKHFDSDDADWKLTAVFAMGYVNGFAKEIAQVIHSGDQALVFEAVRAAGTMDVPGVAPRIRELATSKETDIDLRLVAIDTLPHVDPDSYDILQELSRSNDDEIAEAAEAALDELAIAGQPDEEFEDDDMR